MCCHFSSCQSTRSGYRNRLTQTQTTFPANTCMKMCRWLVRSRRGKGHPNEREEGKSWAARGVSLNSSCTLNTYTHLYRDNLTLALSPTNKIVLIFIQREKQQAAWGNKNKHDEGVVMQTCSPKHKLYKNKVGVAECWCTLCNIKLLKPTFWALKCSCLGKF